MLLESSVRKINGSCAVGEFGLPTVRAPEDVLKEEQAGKWRGGLLQDVGLKRKHEDSKQNNKRSGLKTLIRYCIRKVELMKCPHGGRTRCF